MRRTYFILAPVLLLCTAFIYHKSKVSHNKKSENKATHWSVDIGKTSHRTNVSLNSDYLIIGSNGDNFRDAWLSDYRNGVHIINRKTGKKIKNFSTGNFGDLDVNGTLIHGNRIYFGNDNDEFICADFNGKIKYSLPISGDVECEPVLIKIKSKDAIVFGTEAGELRAISPLNGETIWQHFHEDFDGWKMGDNRLVFKIKTHFYQNWNFNLKPVTKDLNKDGVLDLVFFLHGDFYSVNGADGKILHQFKLDKKRGAWNQPNITRYGCAAESITFRETEKGDIVFSIPKYTNIPKPKSDYGILGHNFYLSTYDLGGNNFDSTLIDEKIKSREFFKVPNTNLISNGEKLYHFDSQMNLVKSVELEKFEDFENKYITTFYSNDLIEYQGKKCVILLFEQPHKIAFFDIDTGKALKTFELEERSEFIPVISDINKDGNMDMLVSDDTGKLTCINLGAEVKILNKKL